MKKIKIFFLLLLITIIVSACGVEMEEEDEVIDISMQLIQLLQDNNWEQFAEYVHSEQGLLLSSNATIEESDITFTKEEVESFSDNNNLYMFENGEKYTPAHFVNEMLLKLEGAEIEYTSASIQRSQIPTIVDENNIEEIYPNARYIEMYSPSNQENGDDWQAIRFVFEKDRRNQYLIAIVRETPIK